jgi:outer membrane protein TolC
MRLISVFPIALTASLLSACATPPDLTALETAVVSREARIAATQAETSFGRAIAFAVRNSPALGRGEATLREAEADLLAESRPFLPQVSAGLRPEGAGFGVTSFGSLSQLIFDGGASSARATAARARVIGGVSARLDAASRAALSAVEAWAGVVTARSLLRASEASLAALEATTAQIADRASAGLGASTDVLTAQSRLANERASVVAARSDLIRANAVYLEVFGAEPGADLTLPPRAPRALAGGAEDSPTLRQAEAELLAAAGQHAAAEAGRFPSVALAVTAIPGTDVVAGLATEQMLSPNRSRAAQVAAAAARMEARRVDLDAIRREMESRLRILQAETRAAEDRLTAARAASEANRANLSMAREQFEVGRRSLIELLDAEREALSSERQLILAERDRVLIGYAALAATGDILDLFGISLEPSPAMGSVAEDRALDHSDGQSDE